MGGRPQDHDRAKARPFLIAPDGEGGYRLTLRETRYNSQNYPLVRETAVHQRFATTAAARAFASTHYGAVAGEFAVERKAPPPPKRSPAQAAPKGGGTP